jgi:site-specific DNA recombinase
LPVATPDIISETAAADTGDATAVIYLRVSSSGQVNKAHDPLGYSIPGQHEACARHAERLGARVIAEYVEPGRTGTNTRRPALQEMLGKLPELKPTYVIFYDLSRVAREELDAFWLLGEIKRCGAKLESTLERIDDSPQGLLLFAIMAGVNAFRSRGDGEKVKLGHERKFIDGGTIGPARTGYLNIHENVEGREVASVVPDPERSAHIQLAFDLAATGEHTITTITDVLADAGLRTRPTRTRPSHPLSRSMVHRILRDDYYLGIVTRNGVKRQGRHEALIDQATFDQVQKVLDGHRASGDRSHKHHHYLKGSIFCACGKRLGYGRHRGKCGGIYEYFSCLSRLQRGQRCQAPYFPVERTERAVVRRYKRETYKHQQQNEIREALRAYVHAKTEVARRESARHTRRLRELTGEQQKLVQLYYRGGVSEDVLKAEQQRIETERTKAKRWADAAHRETQDVMAALDDALILLDDNHVIYETLPNSSRRLVNLAIFQTLIVRDPDTIQAQRTPLYDELARLARNLQQAKKTPEKAPKRPRTPQNKGIGSQDEPSPISKGRGSYIEQMAGATGLEPAASGVTGAITDGLATHESPLFKPNLGFCGGGGHPLKNPQFAGFRSGFGHKSRFVPNRPEPVGICDF